MLRIHYLQHVPFGTPGSILSWAESQGHHVPATRLYDSERAPYICDFDWLVIMGGPMNIYEESPYP